MQAVWAWTAVVSHLSFPVFNSDGCLQIVEPWRELRKKEGEKKRYNLQCSPVPRTVSWLTRALKSAKVTLCYYHRPMLRTWLEGILICNHSTQMWEWGPFYICVVELYSGNGRRVTEKRAKESSTWGAWKGSIHIGKGNSMLAKCS